MTLDCIKPSDIKLVTLDCVKLGDIKLVTLDFGKLSDNKLVTPNFANFDCISEESNLLIVCSTFEAFHQESMKLFIKILQRIKKLTEKILQV